MKRLGLSLLIVTLTFFCLEPVLAQKRKDKKNAEAVDKAANKAISDEQKKEMDRHFFNALREKNNGNLNQAAESFRKVLSIDPENDAALYELGKLFLAIDKKEEALILFEEAVRIKPENEWYLMALSDVYEAQSKYKEAAEVYRKAIVLKPSNIEYYFDYASMLLYQSKFEEAIKTYNQIQEKIGVTEELSVQKEKIWLKLGKVDKAVAEINELIKHNPKETRYKLMLAEIYNANDRKEEALKIYSSILEEDSTSGMSQLSIADYYRMNGQDEIAHEYLLKAFANRTLDIDNKVRILSAYFAVMTNEIMMKRALELGDALITAHPEEAKAHAIYGDFLYQNKQLKEALTQYKKTLEIDSKVFAVWQNLLFIQAELADYQSLEKSSDEALTLFPSQPLVYYLNAAAKVQVKKYEEAVSSYKNGIALIADNRELEAQMYAGMGDAYHSLDKHAESDAAYENSLRLKPDEPYVLNNYAYYLSLRGVQLEKAERMSKRSNELLTANSSFLDTYAWILFRMDRYDEAKVWIEKAMQNGGDKSAVIMEHYGDILFKLNQPELALSQWQLAKKLGGDSELLLRKINDKKFYKE